MTDDHDRLRQAMEDLSKHGGNADMYERALAKARQMRRRNTMMATGAAAVAALGIAGGIVAVAGGRPSDVRVAVKPSATSSSPSSPPSVSPSLSPTPSRAASSLASNSPSSAQTSNGCPVRTSTLQVVSGLPDGFRLTQVKCWHGWASAGVIAPSPDTQGDGVILFRFSRDNGWRKYGEGSAWNCNDLGIKRIPGDPPPFCAFR